MISSKSASSILRYVQKIPNIKFSWLGPLGSHRENVIYLFSYYSKESYGGEAVFVPDVDYFGDFYRGRRKPKKQGEEPLGSVCQATSA